jgi:hypothetical protein
MDEVVGLGAGVLAHRLGGSEVLGSDDNSDTIHRIKVFPLRPHHRRGDIRTSVLSGFDAIINIDAMVVHNRE